MDNPSEIQYLEFLTSSWSDTVFYEFRLADRLLMVAVVDHLVDSLSSVYTFFEPDYAARSLGVYAILWALQKARSLGLQWLYLGYWIEASPKMRYKSEYQPQEQLQGGRWMRVVEK
jgi:arginine-tRNA-protein transferase